MPEVALEESRTSAVHRSRLRQGWALFCWYIHVIGVCFPEIVGDYDQVNQVLADFVQWCHDKPVKLWLARVAILAV